MVRERYMRVWRLYVRKFTFWAAGESRDRMAKEAHHEA